MKMIIKGVVLLTVLATGAVYAKEDNVFSVDSTRLLRESREGRNVLALNESDKKAAMELEYSESKKIAELRNELEEGMRGGKLTEEVLQEKYEQLNRLQRKAKHLVEDAREDLQVRAERRVLAFRNKVHRIAGEYFEKEGGALVFDKATPGIIYVAQACDKTDEVLKEVNTLHDRDSAKSSLTRSSKKNA